MGYPRQKRINLKAAQGVAIREYQTDTGPADHVLFVDENAVGIIEAKRAEEGVHLSMHEDHGRKPGRFAGVSCTVLLFILEDLILLFSLSNFFMGMRETVLIPFRKLLKHTILARSQNVTLPALNPMHIKLLVTLFYLSITAAATAQATDSTITGAIPADTILRIVFTKTETPAAFPGGPKAWVDFLIDNLNSDVAANNGAPVGTYNVIVRFVVLTDGSVRNVTAVTNQGFGMELELRRMLYTTPKWIPAMQNGRKVDSYLGMPVTFVVEE